MRWKKNRSMLTLEPQDFTIMAQCDMHVSEMIRQNRRNSRIPPLWSVLSYVMLQYHCEPPMLWRRYRELRDLASSVARFYYHFQIPKGNGGFREIYAPDYSIRQQQSFIMENILSGLPVDPHACAYRKGVRMQQCAKAHVGKALLIHMDLHNFFGSVTENMVYRTFCEETGYSKSLCRFLAQLCCLHGSLPQGTVTSPMLSNIVFRNCDERLARLAKSCGMNYSRYSDDLYFSGEDRDVGVFLQKVETILSAHGFRLNAEKTQVRRRQHRQEVLGMTVNDRIQVTRQYRRDLLQELYYHRRFGERCNGAVTCGDYLNYMQQLQGKIAYVLHVDPENRKFLEEKQLLAERIKRYQLG